MKKVIFILYLNIIFIVGFGQTQKKMNTNFQNEYEKVDEELNHIYKKILYEYKGDSVFIHCMVEAQRQWIIFRDAQVKMKYPIYNNAAGSSLPMCINTYLRELTCIRIIELRQWLEGVEEGDVCGGSIKLKLK